MALVQLLDMEQLEGADRAMAESGHEQYGTLLETWRAILNKPGLFAAYLPFLRQVAGPGALDPGIKDASALLVGSLNHCRYTVSHRYASAHRNGVTDDTLRQVVAGQWDGLDERFRLALELTRQLTLAPPLVPYAEAALAVDDDVLARAKEHFDAAELVELTMSISVWNALARFHRVMDFDLDMPAAPKGIDPS